MDFSHVAGEDLVELVANPPTPSIATRQMGRLVAMRSGLERRCARRMVP